MPSTFEPQRHCTVVNGRPVQVPEHAVIVVDGRIHHDSPVPDFTLSVSWVWFLSVSWACLIVLKVRAATWRSIQQIVLTSCRFLC